MLHTSPYKNEITKIGDGGIYPQKITKKSKVQNLKLSASMPPHTPYNFNIMNRATIYIDICIYMYVYVYI